MKFTILLAVAAVVATAPYDKKVFSDEFIDELKKELLEKVKPQDARPLVPIKPGPFSCAGRKDGNYANPLNCNSFISCSSGLKYVRDCPSDLNYNPRVDKCVYSHLYKCPPIYLP